MVGGGSKEIYQPNLYRHAYTYIVHEVCVDRFSPPLTNHSDGMHQNIVECDF